MIITILIFFLIRPGETSNSHISGSNGPKIFIRGPNSRSRCQLSDGLNGVMFLIILTLVLAGNSKILNCVFGFLHFAGLKGQYTSKLLLGLKNRQKTKFFA